MEVERQDRDERTTSADCDVWSSSETRNPDGTLKLRNPYIDLLKDDFLYHLALGTATHDLQEMFGDVKFVCMGGAPKRMETFAHFIMDEIGYKLPTGTQLQDISYLSNRYAMYKVGPVLSVSHGMGAPSLSILLHEMIKLMYYAKCKDPVFIRIGTSGGIGVEGGTVVISDGAVDGQLRSVHEMFILGEVVHRPTQFDMKLVNELKSLVEPTDPFKTVTGKTMCTHDFFEGQGRLDGAFCGYTDADKMAYLKKLQAIGVANIEMESTLFAGITYHAGIRAAIVCVTLLNRLNGDQISTPKEVMNEWQKRPQILVSRLIKKYLNEQDKLKHSNLGNGTLNGKANGVNGS